MKWDSFKVWPLSFPKRWGLLFHFNHSPKIFPSLIPQLNVGYNGWSNSSTSLSSSLTQEKWQEALKNSQKFIFGIGQQSQVRHPSLKTSSQVTSSKRFKGGTIRE